MGPFRDKFDEWVDASHGRVRADVAQRKLEAMGYPGSARTTRRAVADAKAVYRAGHRRRFRPWLPEPGLWFQWDYADGPLVEGRKTWLWCAWLAPRTPSGTCNCLRHEWRTALRGRRRDQHLAGRRML